MCPIYNICSSFLAFLFKCAGSDEKTSSEEGNDIEESEESSPPLTAIAAPAVIHISFDDVLAELEEKDDLPDELDVADTSEPAQPMHQPAMDPRMVEHYREKYRMREKRQSLQLKAQGGWDCLVCSQINPGLLSRCSACGARKNSALFRYTRHAFSVPC